MFERGGDASQERRVDAAGGEAAARLCIASYIERKEGTSPFCYIVNGNEESLKVFQDALGFTKEGDTFWAGFRGFESKKGS